MRAGRGYQDRTSDTQPAWVGRHAAAASARLQKIYMIGPSLKAEKCICPFTRRVVHTCPPAMQRTEAEAERRGSLEPFEIPCGFR